MEYWTGKLCSVEKSLRSVAITSTFKLLVGYIISQGLTI